MLNYTDDFTFLFIEEVEMEQICPACTKRISDSALALGLVIRVNDNYYHFACLQELKPSEIQSSEIQRS